MEWVCGMRSLSILEERKSKIQPGQIPRKVGVSEKVRSSSDQASTTSSRTLFLPTTHSGHCHGLLIAF